MASEGRDSVSTQSLEWSIHVFWIALEGEQFLVKKLSQKYMAVDRLKV